jgi:DNA-binding beta-propeller fold protein YncE
VVAIQAGPSIDSAIQVGAGISDIAVAPSGNTLYLAATDNVLAVDVPSGTVKTLPFGNFSHLLVSPDGKTLYGLPTPGNPYIKDGSAVLFFDLTTATYLGKTELSTDLYTFALSRDGKTIYVGTADSTPGGPASFVAISADMSGVIRTVSVPRQAIRIIASPADVGIYVLDGSGTITVLDPTSFNITASFIAAGQANDMAVNSKGTRLLVTDTAYNEIRYYDAETMQFLGEVDTGVNPLQISVNATKGLAYVLHGAPSYVIGVLNSDAPQRLDAIPTNVAFQLLALAPNQAHGFALSPTGVIEVLDLTWLWSGRQLASIDTGLFTEGSAANSPTQRLYVGNEMASNISIIDTQALKVVQNLATPFFPGEIITDPAGQNLYCTTAESSNLVWIYNVASNAFSSIDLGAPGSGLSLSPNGEFLFVALTMKNQVAVVSLLTNAVLGTITTDIGPVDVATAFMGKNERLFVANQTSNTLTMYAPSVGASALARIQLQSTPVALILPADGRDLLIQNQDNSISSVNLSTLSVDNRWFVNGEVSAVGVSPEGGRIYTTNSSGFMWDLDRSDPGSYSTLLYAPIQTVGMAVQH